MNERQTGEHEPNADLPVLARFNYEGQDYFVFAFPDGRLGIQGDTPEKLGQTQEMNEAIGPVPEGEARVRIPRELLLKAAKALQEEGYIIPELP